MRKDNLRYAMERRGHNVPSLAEVSGISERTLWRLLADDASVSEETLLELSKALECSVDFLVGSSPDPNPQMRFDNLSEREIDILRRIRSGDKLEAIRLIASH